MKRKIRNQCIIGITLLVLFTLYTVSLTFVDMQPIGPQGTYVAYAGINKTVHELFGVNMMLYNITDWSGVVAIFIALGFSILGLMQWINTLCTLSAKFLRSHLNVSPFPGIGNLK